MSEPTTPSVGVPQWLFAIFVTAFLGSVGVMGLGVFVMRDASRDHENRLSALEKTSGETKNVEKRLISVEAKLDLLVDRLIPPPKVK